MIVFNLPVNGGDGRNGWYEIYLEGSYRCG